MEQDRSGPLALDPKGLLAARFEGMSDESPPEKPREPPKLKLVKGKRGQSLTVEQYEKLAEVYMELKPRSARSLARTSGVSFETAAKAVRLGWPHRGWAPLAERAKLYDAQMAAATDRKVAKTTVEALDEQLHLAMRLEQHRMMQGLRALAMAVSARLQGVLDTATCTREGTRYRIIQETRGKKVVERQVRETVVLAPYLPDVASAIREMSSVVVAAASAEQRLFVAKVPEGARKIGGTELTDEQITYIRENGGKLPEGVTREMLGW